MINIIFNDGSEINCDRIEVVGFECNKIMISMEGKHLAIKKVKDIKVINFGCNTPSFVRG